MTYDQIAAGYILSGRKIPKALLREAAQAAGEECPECGRREVEDNGHTEYRCVHCDHRWGTDAGHRYGY